MIAVDMYVILRIKNSDNGIFFIQFFIFGKLKDSIFKRYILRTVLLYIPYIKEDKRISFTFVRVKYELYLST